MSIKFKISNIVKRIVWILTVGIIVLSGSLLIYVNIKKNDISHDLLGLANEAIQGSIVVGKISLGSLFSFPDIDVILKDVKVFTSKTNTDSGSKLVIDIPIMKFNTDLTDILDQKLVVNKVIVDEAWLFLESDSLEQFGISMAFSQVKKKSVVKGTNNFSLFIDTIQISKIQIIIKEASMTEVVPIEVENLDANFIYENDFISGKSNFSATIRDYDSINRNILADLPWFFKGNYSIDLNTEQLQVESNYFSFNEVLFSMGFRHIFKEVPSFNLKLRTQKDGINLGSLISMEKDTIENEEHIRLTGNCHLNMNISWQKELGMPFIETLRAKLNLEGDSLKIDGIDLDGYIDKYKRSQNFNLVDIGAVMFTGPVGLAITKGGDYTMLALNNVGDKTEIEQFVSDWRLEKGRLEIEDVAMRTKKNRLVISGYYKVPVDSLDFNLYIVDKRGCELAEQHLFGYSDNVKYGEIDFVKTFLGPVRNFFRGIGLAKCEIVYEGKVDHPEN